MNRYSKITIIGGSGFVGTNLCMALSKEQIDFEIIDIKKSLQFPEKCKIGDVRDINSLKCISGDIVINLAAIHSDNVRDKNDYYRTNVDGAANLVNICIEKSIKKIIFTSSVAVYGFAKVETNEDGPINPFNEYGKTKFLAEEIFNDWYKSGGRELIIIRPTVIFGEGNRGNVYNLFQQISSGKFIMIGSGKNKKSMAYIKNVVSFLKECIKTDKQYAIYNYVDTPDLDMNSLVTKIREKLNINSSKIRIPYTLGLILGYIADLLALIFRKKLPLSSIRVKKFCSSTSFSSSKKNLNNFNAPFKLEEGIDQTLYNEFINPDKNQEIFYSE